MNKASIPKITLWSCILGHGLEIYDFTLYGAFTTFIASHFFSNVTSEVSFFSALIALSVGYFARPLGALIFGYIGDIYGRKRTLVLTISLASLATGAIGICPSYSSIGIVSSIILLLARLAQGLCAGSETSDASILLIEQSVPERSSYGSAMIFLSGGTGCLIALFISKLFITFDFVWAWRIPFILGFGVGIIVLYLRLNMEESLEFKRNALNKKSSTFNLFYKVLKNYQTGFLKAIACGFLSGITSTTIVVFVNLFLHKVLKMEIGAALSFSFYGLFSFLLSCYLCSKISSKIIRNKVISFAIAGLVLSSWLYFYMIGSGQLLLIILAQILLGLLSGSFIAPVKSYLSEQFPVEVRCTGVSVGYNTGYALTAGLYPILAFKLISITGNIYSPAIFIFVFSSLAFLVINLKPISMQTLLPNESN